MALGQHKTIPVFPLRILRVNVQFPEILVLETTKGKGVSYMEGQVGWHGKAPNDEEYARGMAELSAQLAELEAV